MYLARNRASNVESTCNPSIIMVKFKRLVWYHTHGGDYMYFNACMSSGHT